MKKFISFLMAIVLCMAFCVPVFAEDAPAPTEVSPNYNGIINVNGNCIISQPGEVQAAGLYVSPGQTLTIAENVIVKVAGNDQMNNHGTIIVYGTLDLSGRVLDTNHNDGTIIVYGTLISGDEWESNLDNDGKGKVIIADCCGGKMIGEFKFFWEEPEHVDHYYISGVCGCGAKDPSAMGSTISEGNIWILAGIAVVAVVTISVVVARKKKKSALVSGTENTDEE